MDQRTASHLATARSNREFAVTLVNDYDDTPPSLNWVAVVAFYAAVHYVNAYLWEVARLEPFTHGERAKFLAAWPILTPLVSEYKRLQIYSINARYSPGFRMQPGDVRELLDTDLAAVAQVIESALLPVEE